MIVGSVDINLTKNNLKAKKAQEDAETASTVANEAKETATNALQSANGKSTNYYGSTMPEGEQIQENDTWFAQDEKGNCTGIYRFLGGKWTKARLDYNALNVEKLSALSADLGDVTAGTLRGLDIFGGNIAIGDLQPPNQFSEVPYYPLVVDSKGRLKGGGGKLDIYNGRINAYQVNIGDINTGENGKFEAVCSPYDASGYFCTFKIDQDGTCIEFDDEFDYSRTNLLSVGLKTVRGEKSKELPGQLIKRTASEYRSNGITSFVPTNSGDYTSNPIAEFEFLGAAKYNFKSSIVAPSINIDNLYLGGEKLVIDSGTISIAGGNDDVTSATVVFNKKFSSSPRVIVTPMTKVPGTIVKGVGASNIAVDACDIYVCRSNSTSTVLHWVAIGK